jgi:superfamily II DNA or RNA helicase
VPPKLAEGVYEHLVTRGLAGTLQDVAPALADVRALTEADLPGFLAKNIAREIHRALSDADGVDAQLTLFEGLLAALAKSAPDLGIEHAGVAPPPRLLTAIYRNVAPLRPATPLTTSTLLTRNRAEPALGHEIGREIESADAVDLLAAFITLGGVRAVRESLERFSRRSGTLRVLTTVFTGTTQVEAIDALARLPGVEVRISYDVRRTRLHAKAWLFERESGLHSAYIGSANLTATALGAGHEWMVKVCAADLPQVIDKFRGTFESLWNDTEFERYDPTSESHRQRLRKALRAERSGSSADVSQLFTLRAFPFQQEILDRLAAERDLHGRHRNLLVAATGTGKTVIAAFDYERQAARAGTLPRLLFLAHRRELLDQARSTFRHVLRDGAFGELLCDGETPERWEHVFATVQSAATILLERFTPEHFRHVVIDECHHAPADSYQRIVRFVLPQILLGLTATPERTDGKSLLPDFDGRIAAELRLWHALERQLLVPFEYYGISDGTDLTNIRWTRSGYQAAELAHVYTGNEARVALIVEQLRRRVVDVSSVRALAFCVSVEHAEFMARALSARGVPALSVHGETAATVRSEAPRRLRERECNVLCTCDLYNEGIDLPFVDTLLLLRPTASATVFLQQLGRGLRLDAGKASCLVLDFIGQHRADFRFDDVYAALANVPRGGLAAAVEAGFPFLPSGCVLELDAVARDRVLDALKRVIPTTERIVREIREAAAGNETITLGDFLKSSGRDLEDIYRARQGWTTLLGKAGLLDDVSAETADLSRRLGCLVHVDEPARLRAWTDAVEDGATHDGSEAYRRRLTMLEFQLHHRGVLREPADTAGYLAGHPAIRSELRELADVLGDRIGLAEERYPVEDWPLALHHHYSRREIVAAIGFVKPGQKGSIPQGGILKREAEQREILLVTLDKSSASFSPTTRYKDYAISPALFHWETQASASVSRPSGRRYLDSGENGWSFYLFVREAPDSVEQYAFLGPVRLRAHSGDRPIAITWDLVHPMPAGLFEQFATLAQG